MISGMKIKRVSNGGEVVLVLVENGVDDEG